MLILRCSSSAASMHELVKAAQGMLLLDPAAMRTKKELEAAFLLAESEFSAKKNISGKMANEALLFLANETNFSSAARKIGAKSVKDFVLVSKKGIPISKLKKKLLLKKCRRLALPEWGKKIGKYSEGGLAIERMALSRILNR
ncbi:TPA: hypothetical protein HA225_00380 [Candidatus Micrarchaeota archaeon]|nr:hypothetical protein [Candidatus Micrarchaeota archaeon]HIH30899.1 hypothetical protein [Candidatus Micrarchaeota archaeon]